MVEFEKHFMYAGLNIANSVADMEHSLANILEAEGNKIQKVVCTTQCTAEMLEVNASVQQTITSIIQLEQVLYSKLQIAKELCTASVINDVSRK